VTLVDVLIPTYGRKTGLAIVLTSLLGQTFHDFNVIISDQTEDERAYLESIEIQTLVRALRWHGHQVVLHRHLPRQGMAEQRQFLLEQSSAPYVHFIDDDVLLDPPVMQRMVDTLRAESCGFVGCAATGLHLLHDVRPHQQKIELWEGPVMPEPFTPEMLPWDRHLINNAANPLHLEKKLVKTSSGEGYSARNGSNGAGSGSSGEGEVVRYKVAWVGGANVLYDREKLLSVGGFSWWRRLPVEHAGEEVVAQFMLIRKYGGCGILPSGTYHLGLPTTVEDRRRNATELFADLIREYDSSFLGEEAYTGDGAVANA
jgi:glycosyltransferase involved in cell wall biosynthesis